MYFIVFCLFNLGWILIELMVHMYMTWIFYGRHNVRHLKKQIYHCKYCCMHFIIYKGIKNTGTRRLDPPFPQS